MSGRFKNAVSGEFIFFFLIRAAFPTTLTSSRTAFILYLFEAIRAILFDQHPELHTYELRLPLPCDENIFAASTEGEWRTLNAHASNVSRLEYPVILSLFLCHEPMEVSLHFSVMGGFTVLHGE